MFYIYLHARALSPVYKALFKQCMRREGLLAQIDPAVWRVDWNVDAAAPGSGEHALRCLASYVFRVALSDRRIVSASDSMLSPRP